MEVVAAAGPRPVEAEEDRLWTRQFVQLCAGGFLSYASQTPIMPIIALWVVHLGGSATTVGFVAAAFSAPSFLLRPFIGRLCDTWSARGVFAAGCIISGAGSFLILVPSLPLVFVSQVLNGTGWAALNTGGYTMLADIAPPKRRGAASSYLQIARTSLGFYLPYVALKLKAFAGFWLPFLLTAIAGILAAPTVLGVKERPKLPRPALAAGEKRSLFDTLFERDSLFASSLLFFSTVSGPAAGVFIILYAKHLGISEGKIATLFLIRGLFSIAAQSLLAGLSDRIGRAPAIAVGYLTTAGSMVLLSQATGLYPLMLGMVLSTTGGALGPPAIQAMAIDRSRPERRGAAMATFSLSFQLGSFVGGIAGGFLIDLLGYSPYYAVSAVPALFALVLLISHWRSLAPLPPAIAAGTP